jgi:hypothetical protein
MTDDTPAKQIENLLALARVSIDEAVMIMREQLRVPGIRDDDGPRPGIGRQIRLRDALRELHLLNGDGNYNLIHLDDEEFTEIDDVSTELAFQKVDYDTGDVVRISVTTTDEQLE